MTTSATWCIGHDRIYGEVRRPAAQIGAPPGYVGYEEGGQLTEAVRRKPYLAWCCSMRWKRHTPTCSTSCCRCWTMAALLIVRDVPWTSRTRSSDLQPWQRHLLNDLEQRRANAQRAQRGCPQADRPAAGVSSAPNSSTVWTGSSATREPDEGRDPQDRGPAAGRPAPPAWTRASTSSWMLPAAKDFIIDSAYDSVYGARHIKQFIRAAWNPHCEKAIIPGGYARATP